MHSTGRSGVVVEGGEGEHRQLTSCTVDTTEMHIMHRSDTTMNVANVELRTSLLSSTCFTNHKIISLILVQRFYFIA